MRRLPLIFFLVHAGAILALAVCIYASLRAGYQEWVQLWTLAVVLDLPVVPLLSIAEASARPVLEHRGRVVWWVVYPTLAHILIGGFAWSLLGWVIAWSADRGFRLRGPQ